MTKPKFTKGKWSIQPYRPYDKHILIQPAGIVVDNDDVDPNEAKANAHLVAAAPLMYTAAVEIIDIFGMAGEGWGSGGNRWGDTAMDKLIAAVAKARGEK